MIIYTYIYIICSTRVSTHSLVPQFPICKLEFDQHFPTCAANQKHILSHDVSQSCWAWGIRSGTGSIGHCDHRSARQTCPGPRRSNHRTVLKLRDPTGEMRKFQSARHNFWQDRFFLCFFFFFKRHNLWAMAAIKLKECWEIPKEKLWVELEQKTLRFCMAWIAKHCYYLISMFQRWDHNPTILGMNFETRALETWKLLKFRTWLLQHQSVASQRGIRMAVFFHDFEAEDRFIHEKKGVLKTQNPSKS